MSGKPTKLKPSSEPSEPSGTSEPTVTPISGKFQQLQHDMGVALTQGINSNNRLDRIEKIMETITTSMAQSQQETNESLKVLATNLNALVVQLGKTQAKSEKILVDGDGDVVMTSYDIPSNHLSGGDSFKGTDVDVERFVAMCSRQFKYYRSFYSTETKRVEFIESHLGSASDWYYQFLSEEQKNNPNSELLLNELTKYYLTKSPDTLKLRKLTKLTHRWGNAVEFVTKFRLYATSLHIPEILQLQYFEERVQPLVKKKLMDLEPESRTMEKYYQMLMTYDHERDRHWTPEQLRGSRPTQSKPDWKDKKKNNFGEKKNN